jgi:hypothetical protein
MPIGEALPQPAIRHTNAVFSEAQRVPPHTKRREALRLVPSFIISLQSISQSPNSQYIMSVYSRIFATTSKRLTSAAASGGGIPPLAFWAAPGAVAFTWFIWGALTDEIKQSVGLYYDPDAIIKRVEMERTQRLEAKGLLKAASKSQKDEEEEDEEDEDEEEEVTAETIEAAVNKAVKASEDADEEEEEEDEEGEEEEKPKKPKVDFNKLTKEEKWEHFAEKSVVPGEDDEEDEVGTSFIMFLLFPQ